MGANSESDDIALCHVSFSIRKLNLLEQVLENVSPIRQFRNCMMVALLAPTPY